MMEMFYILIRWWVIKRNTFVKTQTVCLLSVHLMALKIFFNKLDRSSKQTFLQRRHTDGCEVYEQMLKTEEGVERRDPPTLLLGI